MRNSMLNEHPKENYIKSLTVKTCEGMISYWGSCVLENSTSYGNEVQ